MEQFPNWVNTPMCQLILLLSTSILIICIRLMPFIEQWIDELAKNLVNWSMILGSCRQWLVIE
jgi:hypothetical protein